MTKRLVEGKRVRSHIITHIGLDCPIDDAVEDDKTWMVQDDITIIGFQLDATVSLAPGFVENSGYAAADVELSRAGQRRLDSILGKCVATLVIIEIGTGGGLAGPSWNHVEMMFPEGYGIEVDEGEYVNSFFVISNHIDTAGVLDGAGSSIIFYVER